METPRVKKSRASSSDEARRYRQQGHDDALLFALAIGLDRDYKNDLKAKKDVIDPSGDSHSVKSGEKKWQIFLYGLNRFETDALITNPPFKLFQEFAERSLRLAKSKVILFGKIQALEGQKRATFMENSPLKTVYVFKKRINPMRNGSPVDENGKPWASTIAFAWYVWEKGYQGLPAIKWI